MEAGNGAEPLEVVAEIVAAVPMGDWQARLGRAHLSSLPISADQ